MSLVLNFNTSRNRKNDNISNNKDQNIGLYYSQVAKQLFWQLLLSLLVQFPLLSIKV